MSIIILIFSMLLSPEITLYASQKDVVIRIDDILLILIFISWFVKISVNRELGVTVKNPLNKILVAYTLSAAVSTSLAVIRGDLAYPINSYFFVLKYFEYFLLFFLVINNIENEKHLKMYLAAALTTCIIVAIYAYSQIGRFERLSTPFESSINVTGNTIEGEPGTLGGYLLLCIGVILGFLSEYSFRKTLALWVVLIFITVPFIMTFSRSSYAGLLVVMIAYLFLAKSKKIFFAAFTALIIVFISFYSADLKEKIIERVAHTFKNYSARTEYAVEVAGKEFYFESSFAQRLRNYQYVATYFFPKRPFFGFGATGVGIMDAQFPRVLGEMGLIGFLIFIWMLYAIFKQARKIYREIDNPLVRSLSLGLIFAFIGIVFQSLGANTFIIVRIMEPFWFLVACVMSLPHIYGNVQPDCKKSGK